MTFEIILFLVLFPLVTAGLSYALRSERLLKYTIYASSVLIAAASILLMRVKLPENFIILDISFPYENMLMFAAEILISLFIIKKSWQYKKFIVLLMAAVQLCLTVYYEFFFPHKVHLGNTIFLDHFSKLMSLIIGVIGSLITVYAVGYMRDFHVEYHKEMKDSRPMFFSVIFIFLSAMFGLCLSNNLLWIFFFWEITTVSSFLLIGYKKSQTAINNSFLALQWNLLGGLAFFGGIMYLNYSCHIIELNKLLAYGKAAVLIPAVLIAIAGMAKSAQIPFSSWLLGAMVAPTPVSALLHSSTMVKAGVYIILRFAPIFEGTHSGFLIALIGAITFLVCSYIAISQADAKKVLAYSTIANLGLIVLCAGVGTYEAVWAGIMLIIFHAVSKCLLFLCVGIVEHKVHSRDIEDMNGLIIKMPKISVMMQIGIAGMFLAPFGMLISKWAVLRAMVDFNPILTVFIVFGSAATLFFWVKWIGKMISVVGSYENIEEGISNNQQLPLFVLAALTVGMCGFFHLVAVYLIEPYVIEVYGKTLVMSHGNFVIMSIMLAMVMLFPLSFFNYGKKVKVVDAYLGGANVESHFQFKGSLSDVKSMQMKNYYLSRFFGEALWLKYGTMTCVLILAILFGAAFL